MNKGVLVVVVVFFGFWLFTDPHGLADLHPVDRRRGVGLGRRSCSRSVIEFLGDL